MRYALTFDGGLVNMSEDEKKKMFLSRNRLEKNLSTGEKSFRRTVRGTVAIV